MIVRALLRRAGESGSIKRAVDALGGIRLARPFLAGSTPDEVLDFAVAITRQGSRVTLNNVGEHVLDRRDAEDAAVGYEAILRDDRFKSIEGGVSLKPSQLGLAIDRALCKSLLLGVARTAEATDAHVTLDMEDRRFVDATIHLVESMHEAGLRNVGCAIQARLYRSLDDIDRMNSLGASVRLCKGAYREPRSAAFRRRNDVRDNYLRCAERLVERGSRPRFATHDQLLITEVRKRLAARGADRNEVEFQMLLGYRPALRSQLIRDGVTLCTYLPFGTEWYPYFMRRLAERPSNIAMAFRAREVTR